MNLNISNNDFVEEIKPYLYKIKYVCSVEKHFRTSIGFHYKLSLNNEKELFKMGYNILDKPQFKQYVGVDFDSIKDDIRYLRSEKTKLKPAYSKIMGHNLNGEQCFFNNYFFVIEGILFYKEPSFNDMYVCCDKNGKVFGADLEVKNENRT